jgi:UDP-glucuronate 4-epimerase
MKKNKILLTGCAGFIGFHLTAKLARENPHWVIHGVDNVNPYYDVQLKEDRLARIINLPNVIFHRMDLSDSAVVEKIFAEEKPDIVINLAAQAGVRYSLENPHAYIDSNIKGFMNILEGCRHAQVKHLLYASSSSVYGASTQIPFSEHNVTDHPVSLYAATKKANEMMAHSYSCMYDLPTTGLRFFTVYGPWGRPDMALFMFTKAIYEGQPINVFNNGKMRRDFTYIDDIVESISRLIPLAPKPDEQWQSEFPDPATSRAPYRIYNIGNNQPEDLMEMISLLEQEIGLKATRRMLPMQIGDIAATFANTDDLAKITGFKPNTSIKTGIGHFVRWYRDYYKIGNSTPAISKG